MSRSGYTEDFDSDSWQLAMWRGQVMSAIRGRRGQAFLRELIKALDAMPERKLIRHELIADPPAFIPPSIANAAPPAVCAIGSLGLQRGVDMKSLDPEDYDSIADAFGVAHQLVQEIEFENDENSWNKETPEARWRRMRDWASRMINKDAK